MMKNLLIANLIKCKRNRLFRTRNFSCSTTYLSFSSNNYLGLADHPEVINSCVMGLKRYGVGSGASQLLGGYSVAHNSLEEELAAFLGYEQVILFSSGYMANLGVITTLFGNKKNHCIFADRLCHASIVDGVLYARTNYKRYKHLDTQDLIELMHQVSAKYKLIISEGVFSMNGDMPPISELSTIAKNHHSWFMLDDAHGIGVLGTQGKGVMEYYNLSSHDVQILVGTFGKAFGTFGAFVAGDKIIIESLIQFARSYIYTTALPSMIVEATRASLKLLQRESWRREYLQSLIKDFKRKAQQLDLPFLSSNTPIQPLVVGDIKRAEHITSYLKERGLLVALVRPPTVPNNTTRLRVSLTANHTEKDIDYLLDELSQAYKMY